MPSTAKKEPKKEEVKQKIEAPPSTGVDAPESTGAVGENFTELIKQFEAEKQKIISQAQSKVLLHEKKKERVAICGFAPTTKDMAPFNDPNVEIWGCNELYEHIPRIDVLFELHERSEYGYTFGSTRGQAHLDWMRKNQVPIYMTKHYEDIPMSLPFPIKHITDRFGMYFNNSISYMIVLAILMKYKWIGIYGVDMAHATEFANQRPSVEYFVGWARGLKEAQGFPEIYIPEESELLKNFFLYGYSYGGKINKILDQKVQHFSKQQQNYANQEAVMRDMKNQYIGGTQTLLDFKRTLSNIEATNNEHKQ